MPEDSVLASLLSMPQDESERALAVRYAPVLLFDAREPFLPLAAGYTLFRQSGPSPSFRQSFVVDLAPPDHPPARLAIEYAIWWDWVARMREAELGIICWHEERPDEIAVLRRVGVDGICSDAPELSRNT